MKGSVNATRDLLGRANGMQMQKVNTNNYSNSSQSVTNNYGNQAPVTLIVDGNKSYMNSSDRKVIDSSINVMLKYGRRKNI